jgi:transcriptional regulator with XRE-family HTH domain
VNVNFNQSPDTIVPVIIGAQIRAARALVDWSRADLANATGLSGNTIANIESEKSSPLAVTLLRIQHALEARGVEFINGDQPGVRRRKAT